MSRVLAAGVTTVIAAAMCIGMARSASAAPATPDILGGQAADGHPFVVMMGSNGSPHCSAVQVRRDWVVTARHCITPDDFSLPGQVFYGRSYDHPGQGQWVDRALPAPHGDVALLHLAVPHPLPHYGDLDLRYQPQFTGFAWFFGYGTTQAGTDSHQLKKARVELAGSASDGSSWNGLGQKAVEPGGAPGSGDSGGPLIVNGRVVGVEVYGVGSSTDVYAVLAQDRDWIVAHIGDH